MKKNSRGIQLKNEKNFQLFRLRLLYMYHAINPKFNN